MMVPKHLLSKTEQAKIPDPQPTPEQQVEMAKAQAGQAKAQADMANAKATEVKAHAEIEKTHAEMKIAGLKVNEQMKKTQSAEIGLETKIRESMEEKETKNDQSEIVEIVKGLMETLGKSMIKDEMAKHLVQHES